MHVQDNYDPVYSKGRPLAGDCLQDPDGTVMEQIERHCRLRENQILLNAFVRVIPPSGSPSAWDTLLHLQHELQAKGIPVTIMICMSKGATARLSTGRRFSPAQLSKTFGNALQVSIAAQAPGPALPC